MAELPRRLAAAREQLAAFLKARPQHLAWLTNATSGINAVLRSLSWQPGEQIVMTNHVYNACRKAVQYLEVKYGVEAVTVDLRFPEEFSTYEPEKLISILTEAVTPRTRLAMLCHISSPTALVFPIAKAAQALAERGVPLLVDGAHAPGALDLDLESLGDSGVTYYTGNLHKWCCAPKGSAFLWVAKAHQSGLHPPVISHGFLSCQPTSFCQEFDWCGTFDPTAWLTAPQALEVLESLYPGGWEELRSRCRQQMRRGLEILNSAFPQNVPVHPAWTAQMATLLLPPSEPEQLHDDLYRRFGIDAWFTNWQERALLRISAAPYNIDNDYHILAKALKSLLPRTTT